MTIIRQKYSEYYRLFNQGVKLFKKERKQEAVKQFQYSLEDLPLGFASYFNLSSLYLKLQNIEEAFKNCEFAIILRSYDGTAYYNRCMINISAKKIKNANSDIQCALSCQYLKQYETSLKLQHLNKALSYCSNNLEAMKQLLIHKKLLKFSQEEIMQDQKQYRKYMKVYRFQKQQNTQKNMQLFVHQQAPFFQLQVNEQSKTKYQNKTESQIILQLKQKILLYLTLLKEQPKKQNFQSKQRKIKKIEVIAQSKQELQYQKQQIQETSKTFKNTLVNKNSKRLFSSVKPSNVNMFNENDENGLFQYEKNKENINKNINIIIGSQRQCSSNSYKKRKTSLLSSKFIKSKECVFEDSNISIYDYSHENQSQTNKTQQIEVQINRMSESYLINSISSIQNGENNHNNISLCNDLFLSLKDRSDNDNNMIKSTVDFKHSTPQKFTDRTFLNISNSCQKISCPKCANTQEIGGQKNIKLQIYLTQIYHFEQSFATLQPYCLVIYKNQVHKTQVSKTPFPSWKDQIFMSYQAEFQDSKQTCNQKCLRIQLWNKQKQSEDKMIGSVDCEMKQGKRKVILNHRGRQSAYMYINSTKI